MLHGFLQVFYNVLKYIFIYKCFWNLPGVQKLVLLEFALFIDVFNRICYFQLDLTLGSFNTLF